MDRSSAVFKPAVEPDIDDLLNIQYTSGTTGFPKGCMLTQRYWLTCAKSYSACAGLRYQRIMAANPFFYMTPQWLMLMAFYQHATLYVAPYISLTHFTDWLRRFAIEYCWFPMDIVAQTMPRPEDLNRGQFTAGVVSVENDIATIRIRGHLAAFHKHPYEKGKTNAGEARVQGAATYDVKKGAMRELILILDGE